MYSSSEMCLTQLSSICHQDEGQRSWGNHERDSLPTRPVSVSSRQVTAIYRKVSLCCPCLTVNREESLWVVLTCGTFKGLSTPIPNTHVTSVPVMPQAWRGNQALLGSCGSCTLAITQSQEEAATPSPVPGKLPAWPSCPLFLSNLGPPDPAGPSLCSSFCCPLLRVESIKMALPSPPSFRTDRGKSQGRTINLPQASSRI